MLTIDTSDPGKAANVVARAAILFARASGYVAENKVRESLGKAIAFDSNCFEAAIGEMFPNETNDPRCANATECPAPDGVDYICSGVKTCPNAKETKDDPNA